MEYNKNTTWLICRMIAPKLDQQQSNPTLLSSTKRNQVTRRARKWSKEEVRALKQAPIATIHRIHKKSPFQSAKNLSPFAGGCPRSRRGEGERSAAKYTCSGKKLRPPAVRATRTLYSIFFRVLAVCVCCCCPRTITYVCI